jgi:DNA-binding FadR family transcriptional regulator
VAGITAAFVEVQRVNFRSEHIASEKHMKERIMTRAIPVTAKPITQARLHQRVVEELLRQIVSGALPPGTTLPSEPELARQFGVSRIVIREAIRILVEKGLITVRHGSGMWVQSIEQWNHLDPMVLLEEVRSSPDASRLSELLELCEILDVGAAERAATRRTPEQLSRLRDLVERMRKVVDDPAAYLDLDALFHATIAESAGNRLLRDAQRPLSEVLFANWLWATRAPEELTRFQQDHEAIYEAIAVGDPLGARQAMHRHAQHVASALRAGIAPAAGELVTTGSDGRHAAA